MFGQSIPTSVYLATPQFGIRQTGTGPYAWTIGRRFEMAARRLGFNERKIAMRTDLFDPPVLEGGQYALL